MPSNSFDIRGGINNMYHYLVESTNEGRLGSDFKVVKNYNENFFKNIIEFLKLRIIKYNELELFTHEGNKIIYSNEKSNVHVYIEYLKLDSIFKCGFHKNKRDIPEWEQLDTNQYIFVIYGSDELRVKYKELVDALNYI